MKRFTWPLQRLLDVQEKREQALQGELADLAQRITQARRQASQRRAILKHALDELDCMPLEQRLVQQVTFLAASGVAQRQIANLEGKVAELKAQRQEVVKLFMAIRAKRKMLEKLRERAMEVYQTEQERLEQKDLDEAAQIAFARGMNKD